MDEQLELLAKRQGLSEAETRLRFLACSLMEEAFQSILPEASLHPFGSSINGFGRRSCDVDMYLDRGTAQGIIPLKQVWNPKILINAWFFIHKIAIQLQLLKVINVNWIAT